MKSHALEPHPIIATMLTQDIVCIVMRKLAQVTDDVHDLSCRMRFLFLTDYISIIPYVGGILIILICHQFHARDISYDPVLAHIFNAV